MTAAAQELLARQGVELAGLRARVANLEIALETSRRIGQVIGIMMALKLVTEHEAFDMLVACSQHSHRKLRELADVVVMTGELLSVA